MEREIKFRAWDKLGKRIGEVNYIKYSDVQYTHVSARFKQKEKTVDEWFNYGSEDGCDNLILMQYTGLHDKNGKEIFDGDLLHVLEVDNTGSFEYVSAVEFKESGFIVTEPNGTEVPLACFYYKDGYPLFEIEIIGNIFENGDLLGENHD